MDDDDDIPRYRQPYVRHLPDDFADADSDHPDLIVSGEAAFSGASFNGDSAPELISLLVGNDIEEFEKTGDPVCAIKVWMACMGAGLYPPPSVLKWVDSALREYYETDGRADLHALLGLRGERGKSPPLARHKQGADAEFRAYWIHLLVEGLGVTIGDAACMVAAREESSGRGKISSDWLAEDYSKRWRKRLLLSELPDFDANWWAAFVETFPDYSRPPGLK